jgi:hypothetical protein
MEHIASESAKLSTNLTKNDLILKTWEALIERAYKLLTLSMAGNLAAAIFLYPVTQDKHVNDVAASYVVAAIPRFVSGAVYGVFGLGALWLLSFYVHWKIIMNVGEGEFQWSKPNRYNTYRAITVGALCCCIGTAGASAWNFIGGLISLSGLPFGELLTRGIPH